MWLSKLFGRKNESEESSSDESQTNVCSDSATCELSNCALLDLRRVQLAIQEMEERLRNLQDKYFPLLFWWVASTVNAGKYLPGHYGHYKLEDLSHYTRGDIQRCLNLLCNHISKRNITQDKFNVEQFCSEVRDFVKNKEAIAKTTESLADLRAEEKRLKESLKIT